MKNILVTGGAGFVGSHACKALAAAGYNPVTLDNLESGHEWAVKWGPLERGISETRRFYDAYSKRGAPKQFCTLPHTPMSESRTSLGSGLKTIRLFEPIIFSTSSASSAL
jgi:NADPH:quinone reductase-like Zn-dependent oxidoreductase